MFLKCQQNMSIFVKWGREEKTWVQEWSPLRPIVQILPGESCRWKHSQNYQLLTHSAPAYIWMFYKYFKCLLRNCFSHSTSHSWFARRVLTAHTWGNQRWCLQCSPGRTQLLSLQMTYWFNFHFPYKHLEHKNNTLCFSDGGLIFRLQQRRLPF